MKRIIELYGTLGPSCSSKEILQQMFQAGMTGLRLNLSHTNLKDCEPWLNNLYEVSDEMHIKPDFLVDLQGPELRIGILNHPLNLQVDTEVRLRPITTSSLSKRESTSVTDTTFPNNTIPVPPDIFPYLEPGQTIRLDDGNILLKVKRVKKDCDTASCEAMTEVMTDGILKSRKSLAIDGCAIELPTLTLQDIENLKVLRKYRVTGVMLPFVRNDQDLITLKKTLIDLQQDAVRIFAKIENARGAEQLPSLLSHCDQIVIARGDLGNAYPLSRLPAIQKKISRSCVQAQKPFLVVTQMLASMEYHPVPTRAEVSDIFNAILDGATSLMLTGETAAGQYPAEAMQVLADTAFEALCYQKSI